MTKSQSSRNTSRPNKLAMPTEQSDLQAEIDMLFASFNMLGATQLIDGVIQIVQAREKEAERRGAAFAMCQLSFETAMKDKKTVKLSWIDREGEKWAIESVNFAQKNNLHVIGYDQVAEFNRLHQLTQSEGREEAKDKEL